MIQGRPAPAVALAAILSLAACDNARSSTPSGAPQRAAGVIASQSSDQSDLPDCDIPTERMTLGAQGEATTVAIAVRITDASGGACVAAGTPIRLRLLAHGHLLHVVGNPAIADLGTMNNGSNVFDWSNWCGSTAIRPLLLANVASGGGHSARYRVRILPACLSRRAPSDLSVITE